MKKLITIIAVFTCAFFACNDTKDPPDDQNAPATTEQSAPAAPSDSTKLKEKS